MCKTKVQVITVGDDELDAPWMAALGDHGERVLVVRVSTAPAEVCAGYAAALEQCPVRIELERLTFQVA